eukprot:scaffold278537_cov31-Tisochrysis_lutea.AAC.1
MKEPSSERERKETRRDGREEIRDEGGGAGVGQRGGDVGSAAPRRKKGQGGGIAGSAGERGRQEEREIGGRGKKREGTRERSLLFSKEISILL